jgi:hypothetical protein
MPLSNYLVNDILGSNFELGTPFVALYSSDPGNDGTAGTDVTSTINASGRVAVSFSTPASRAVANDAEVSFGNAAGAATVSHFGIWDASSGGNFLGGGALAVSRNVQIGDPVAFLIGDLSVSLP